jgi:hypothetical protein
MRRAPRIVAIAAVAGLVLVAPASAAKVVNGGFESGSLSGWNQTLYPHPEVPSGSWLIYGELMRGMGGSPPAPPPRGDFAAFTDQGEVSGMILSQVIRLKRNQRHKLSFQLAYHNDNVSDRRRGKSGGFFTPATLAASVDPNQQFRMDVLKPGAPIKSVNGDDVLKRVYRTDRGDPDNRGFRKITANLTPFAGQRVRLRFAVVVTEDVLNAAIDAVRVRSKPAG